MANEIPISVVDRKIKVGRHVPATMTNIGNDYISISLDNEWLSTNHRLRVTLYSEAPYVSVQNWWDGKSAIEIPQEITSCPAFKVTVALLSEDGYERLVTQAMDEPIENPRNGHDEGSEPGMRTIDIIARIDALAADLEEKRDTDYWRGEPGHPGEPGKDADIAAAEAATSAANEAAINANQAGANANAAAANAESKAAIAIAAAENASEKASLAASKAVEAENAATLANESATNANNAANELLEAAERGEFDGAPGAPGAPGEPGADGYSPTASVTKNGGTATITVTDKNGTTTATVSDGAPGKDGSDATATDVRIKGISITENGIADIPPASYDKLGVVMNGAGIDISTSGVINPKPLMQNMITNRKAGFTYNNHSNDRCAITPSRLDYAVKAAMCDGKGAAWSDAEKLAARERLGVSENFRVIADITTSENGIVVIEKDANGNSFDLSKIEIYYFAPTQQASAPNGGNIAVLNNKLGDITNSRIMTISYGTPNPGKLCDAVCFAFAEGSNCYGYAGSTDSHNGIMNWILSSTSNGNGIKELKFIATSNNVHVPSGTRIVVRGA